MRTCPKVILDFPAPREVLESHGATVVGHRTDTMPAVYSPSCLLPVDTRCGPPGPWPTRSGLATAWTCPGRRWLRCPPPEEAAVPRLTLAPTIERALADAADRDLQTGAVTPFPLQRLRQIEGDRIIETNRAPLRRNVRVATRVGQAL